MQYQRDQYRNDFYQTQHCKFGATCIHLKNTGTCNFFHPPFEIPCYHGANCKYYKSGQCQFNHPQDSNYQSTKQQRKYNQSHQQTQDYYYENYDNYFENQNDYDYDYYYNQSQKEQMPTGKQSKSNNQEEQKEELIEDHGYAGRQNENLEHYLEKDFKKYLQISDNKQSYQQKPIMKPVNDNKQVQQKTEEKKQQKPEQKNEVKPKKKKHDPDDEIIDFRNIGDYQDGDVNFKKGDLPLYAEFFQVRNQKKKKMV